MTHTSNTTRTLTTRKGRSVVTPYSDAEALARLQQLVNERKLPGDGFAGDLLKKSRSRYGISSDQMTWVHILVLGAEKPVATRSMNHTFPGIRRWFDTAAQHLKTPKLALEVGGEVVKIKRAGAQSRHEGSLFIDDGRPYGVQGRRYYGKVSLEGVFFPGSDCTPEIVEVLQAIEKDPVGFAVEHGKRTGNCCFCNRILETTESLAVGYGPICAGHWGLPWGSTTEDNAQDEN